MHARILALIPLLASSLLCAQSQYAQFTATKIQDAAGNKLLSGTITFVPVNIAGTAIAPQASGGGRIVPRPIVFTVVSGVPTASYGSTQLVDVTQASPSNFCYLTSVHDNDSGETWTLDPCLQPAYNASWCSVTSGVTTCNYDNYAPALTAGVPVMAPTLSTGTFTTGAAGSSVACTVNLLNYAPNYQMSCSIPQGVQGIQGQAALMGTERGAYSATTTYAVGDVIAYSGQSYASLMASNTGNEPDISIGKWGLLANLSNLPQAFASQSQANPQPVYASNVVAGTPIANTSGGTGCSGVNCYFNMPRWRSKVANVINGTGYARIMFPGDSTLFGINASVATSVGVDFCADLTTYYSIPCHADSWMGGGNSGNGTYWQSDTRISAGTGWGEGGLATIGVQSLTQSASGGALTFTPTGTVDTFEVYYIQQPSGGVLNVAVDSGTATAINTAGTASMQKAVISASGVGSHVLSHVWSGGGRVDLVGDIAYDSTTPSAIVVLAGAGGSTSAQWSNTSAAYGPGQSAPYSTLGLDAAVVEGGLINDWINSVAPSVSQTHLQTIASALLTAGVDVAFYTPVPSRTATTAQVIQAASVAAMKAVATANHNNNTTQTLPIIDNFSQWGTQAAHSSLWYGGNAVHPNATGYAINAQSVETTIVQSPSQVGGFNVGPWVAGQSIMATSFAPNSVVVAGPYPLLCTEGSVFISGGTLTLPITCPNNYQVQIVTFTSSSVTIAGSLLDASVPTSLAGKSGLVVQFVGGHWWPVARFTNASATALQLSAVLESGNYTALGTEGTIYVNGGTLTLPGLSSIYSGFTVPIINYGSATTISIGGTNHGIPTILPASASALVQYYNSSWWLIAEHGVSDLGSTPTASSGSVTGVNTGGIISGLSGVTSVTLTFAGNPWTTWASCGPTASVSGVIPTISSASTSAFTFSFPSAYTGTLYYLCNGK